MTLLPQEKSLDFSIVLKRAEFTVYNRKIIAYFTQLETESLTNFLQEEYETLILHKIQVYQRVQEINPGQIYLKRAFYLGSERAYIENALENIEVEKYHYHFCEKDEEIIEKIQSVIPQAKITAVENYSLQREKIFPSTCELRTQYFKPEYFKNSSQQIKK